VRPGRRRSADQARRPAPQGRDLNLNLNLVRDAFDEPVEAEPASQTPAGQALLIEAGTLEIDDADRLWRDAVAMMLQVVKSPWWRSARPERWRCFPDRPRAVR
jgi:hypothetical protein